MEPILRASLATLAALSVLGGLSSLMRFDPRARRFEKLGLLAHHAIAFAVAAAMFAGVMLGADDSRALLLGVTGPLLVLCLQDPVSSRAALATVPLVVAGLALQALVLLGFASPFLAGIVAATLGLLAAGGASVLAFVRKRPDAAPRARALVASQIGALAVAAVAAAVALWPSPVGAAAWAVGLGVAGAVGTAARLSPQTPPGARELLAAAVVFSLALAAGAAGGFHVLQSLLVAAWAAEVSLAVFALVRASVDVSRTTPLRLVEKEPVVDVTLPSPQALAAMSPLLDDAILRRPARPRVIARVPARRILDAALDRARSAQPITKGKPSEQLRVDVVGGDGDIDVDGDPADLAEALCAVLDNALRSRAQHPDVKVIVHMRGSPAAVTFEVSDILPEGAEPAAVAGIPDADAPFMHPRADVDRPGLGVALARARVLVERNGGKLLTRSSAEGSTVQLTMPRRIQKGAVGLA